jgi:general secretion pathway protein E
MVGEIRDTETADCVSSLTGHPCFRRSIQIPRSARSRLRDIDVELFLLASTLLGVVAQRLVRVLNLDTRIGCGRRREAGCSASIPPTLAARPCAQGPAGSGYRGQTGIYELVIIMTHARHDP